MSQPVNKSLVGIFIIGAIALLVIAIITYSSFSFSQQVIRCVIFTPESINGLGVNSEVKFKGVKIGVVREIQIQTVDPHDPGEYTIPIILELDKRYIEQLLPPTLAEVAEKTNGDVDEHSHNPLEAYGDLAIEHGLRARIQTANLLTGMLYVEMDFFPDTPAVRRGTGKTGYFEIPTIPSSNSQLFNSAQKILTGLSEIDYKAIGEQVLETMSRVDGAVAQIDFKQISDNIVAATDSINKILHDPELEKAVENVSKISQSLSSISGKIDENASPVASELQAASQDFRKTLDELDQTLVALRAMMQPRNGVIGRDLADALEQLNDAARAVRELADFLRRNPNAIVTGVETVEE